MLPEEAILQLENITDSIFRKQLSEPGFSNGIIKKFVTGLKMLQESRDRLHGSVFERPEEKG